MVPAHLWVPAAVQGSSPPVAALLTTVPKIGALTARELPLLAASLVICLLGLLGTPPTSVFLGKLEAFSAAFDGGYAWLAVGAAVNTVASLFHYLRSITPAVSRGPCQLLRETG